MDISIVHEMLCNSAGEDRRQAQDRAHTLRRMKDEHV